MPICEICGMEVVTIYECSKCEAKFCDECGDIKLKLCYDCLNWEEEEEEVSLDEEGWKDEDDWKDDDFN